MQSLVLSSAQLLRPSVGRGLHRTLLPTCHLQKELSICKENLEGQKEGSCLWTGGPGRTQSSELNFWEQVGSQQAGWAWRRVMGVGTGESKGRGLGCALSLDQ